MLILTKVRNVTVTEAMTITLKCENWEVQIVGMWLFEQTCVLPRHHTGK